MKLIEASQISVDIVWHEGRVRLRLRIRNAISGEGTHVFLDVSEGGEFLLELLTALAQSGQHPFAQLMLQYLFDTYRQIERLDDA